MRVELSLCSKLTISANVSEPSAKATVAERSSAKNTGRSVIFTPITVPPDEGPSLGAKAVTRGSPTLVGSRQYATLHSTDGLASMVL